MTTLRPAFLIACACLAAAAVRAADEFPPMPPVPMLSPAEEAKTFQVPEGYRMELVVSDPVIREPVQVAFDGNGRMYILEMRSYMQDLDGTDEHAPIGVVSRHESTRGDGVYDKHTVFADKLLLPRMLLPVDERVIIGETDTSDLYLYTDTDGDGKADGKTLLFQGGPRGGNLEHQPSGLTWTMDNWMYSAVNSYRIRWDPRKVGGGPTELKENTAPNGGQWGMCQDDCGKPWVVNAGGEKGPLRFQTHVLYGGIDLPQQFPESFREVFPLVGLADVQGGPKRFREDAKTLNHFTAACGGEIFRGDRLPADLEGDLVFGEPVGRLIRRAKVEVKDGVTYLTNVYPGAEFIRSTDPNFRPINMTTGPDGCLYIVDMYHGIIQEGNWTKEGSYLRGVIRQYSLDKNIAAGRIWRLVHKDFTPGSQPRMLQETSAKLVTHLEHPNGWWRDTAQKLLVVRQDKSVVPALEAMARSSSSDLARMHALWTLEGLGAVDPRLLREKLHDDHPRVRAAAIRVSETLIKAGDKSVMNDVQAAAKDPDAGVVIQWMCTTKLLGAPNWNQAVQAAALASPSMGVREIARALVTGGQDVDPKKWPPDEFAVLKKGETAFREICFACHGFDGKGMSNPAPGKENTTMAPPLAGSKTLTSNRLAGVYVLLHGLSGPVNGKTYEAQMIPMPMDDAWIASVVSYVRNSFGNKGDLVTAADVARVRAETSGRLTPWTLEELASLLPREMPSRRTWKVTASHNTRKVDLTLDGDIKTRWDTGGWQTPGMWYQLELPAEQEITGVHMDAGSSRNDYPRGYEIAVSRDKKQWTTVATGKGDAAVTHVEFPPVKARYIKITQTGEVKGKFWSIHELQVLTPPGPATTTK